MGAAARFITSGDEALMSERWPAALRLNQAAEYCGLSVETFKTVCTVKPIEFTKSAWGNRYLRARLDEWLASLDPNAQPSPATRKSWGERLDGRRETQGA
jgi:hypothetical protein